MELKDLKIEDKVEVEDREGRIFIGFIRLLGLGYFTMRPFIKIIRRLHGDEESRKFYLDSVKIKKL
jgi:hypothetical protein